MPKQTPQKYLQSRKLLNRFDNKNVTAVHFARLKTKGDRNYFECHKKNTDLLLTSHKIMTKSIYVIYKVYGKNSYMVNTTGGKSL